MLRAIYGPRIIPGCYGDPGIVLSILELELELEVCGWWALSVGDCHRQYARVERSIVMASKEWQQNVRLLYEVWVALNCDGCILHATPRPRGEGAGG